MTDKLSFSTNGNEKLGPKISVLSRAVGDSCPDSCQFLENSCYAEKTERRFKNARIAGLRNIKIMDWQKIRSFLLDAKKRGNSIRLHERGDWLKTTKNGSKILDKKYIKDFTKAYQSIENPPQIFFYTHVYKSEIAQLAKLGISVFASVGTAGDHRLATKVGFTKFAWSTSLKKGKDKNKKWITETGETIPVCWEQLNIGKNKNTCSECGYCIKPELGSIAFLNH
jgi:hypothetical protein